MIINQNSFDATKTIFNQRHVYDSIITINTKDIYVFCEFNYKTIRCKIIQKLFLQYNDIIYHVVRILPYQIMFNAPTMINVYK